jgi:hypothetical protein
MFGFRFIKTEPTQYVIEIRRGQVRREGAALSFFTFTPTSSLVIVPTASTNEPFIFQETTADFQEVTIQGQVTYRVADPRKASSLLNYTVNAKGNYVSEDPKKLSQRLLERVQVAARAELQSATLTHALSGGDALVARVGETLRQDPMVDALGLEILGLSVLAIKPKPETARALEAGVREALLRQADEATYSRRNAAVEQERAIKESELSTEIAVENKKRQIREAQMDAERAVQERRRQIAEEEMTGKISLEERNRELVAFATANERAKAEAKADGISALMKAFAGSDAKVLQALASVGMEPSQLIALAFRDLAENASKIGQLNVSPDLLREIMAGAPAAR